MTTNLNLANGSVLHIIDGSLLPLFIVCMNVDADDEVTSKTEIIAS